MTKRIAVLVRERQGEALRVALGLTLDDHRVEVYVLDRPVAGSRESMGYLGELAEAGAALFTNAAENAGLERLTVAEIARRMLACDHVIVS